MPIDPHLFNGEGERFRRYGRFLIDPFAKTLSIFEHDKFFQDKKFDQLYGDIHRSFAPMEKEDFENDFFQMLVVDSYKALPLQGVERTAPYEVSAHMIRIEATALSSKGRPAPEGIHRDGYYFGSIHLMRRENVRGADSNIYDLRKNLTCTTRLNEPMDSIYFNDRAILHGVTSFECDRPLGKATRDMLILLYQPLSESPQRSVPAQSLRRIAL